MEFIAEYAGFLARTVTVLAAIIVVLVVIVALRGRGRRGAGGHLDVQKLNDFYKDL
ncbi:TPA: protease SohB, partial [Pseudomonas aeruginosa]